MGLDMQLFRERNLTPEEQKDVRVRGAIVENVSSIRTEIKYWRKAWGIHNFFQDRCVEGRNESDFYVDTDVIEELHEICNRVCEHLLQKRDGDELSWTVVPKLHSDKLVLQQLIPEVFPENTSTLGSFSDGFHYKHIMETKMALDRLTKEKDWGWDGYFYSSSW